MLKDRKGFTLIELLIVVVIIGILAAIAIPKFTTMREKAYFSAMKSDLKNLQAQQEIYYSDPANSYSYASTVSAAGYQPSQGVTITVAGAGTTGWEAKTTHSALAATQYCTVRVGDAPSTFTVDTVPNVVICAGE